MKLRRITTSCYRIGDSDVRIQQQVDGWKVTGRGQATTDWLQGRELMDALFATRAAAIRAVEAAAALDGPPPAPSVPRVRLVPREEGGYTADHHLGTLKVSQTRFLSGRRWWEITRGETRICLAATLDEARRSIELIQGGPQPGPDGTPAGVS